MHHFLCLLLLTELCMLSTFQLINLNMKLFLCAKASFSLLLILLGRLKGREGVTIGVIQRILLYCLFSAPGVIRDVIGQNCDKGNINSPGSVSCWNMDINWGVNQTVWTGYQVS